VREVPDDVVHSLNALGLFGPMALRYYLPRYIAFSVLPTPYDSFSIDAVLYCLGPENPDEPYWVERFSAFVEDERRAIANYIATRRMWEDNETIDLDNAEKIWDPGMAVV
jgi:hypothetical protein